MAKMLVLTEPDLRKIVRLDASAVACVEDAFAALATKAVVMPPILRLDIPEYRGEVDVKTAYVPGIDGFAIKISPGFFDNPKLGLPSVNGMMILLELENRPGRSFAARQWLSHRCAHCRRRRGRGKASVTRPTLRSQRSSGRASRRGCSSRRSPLCVRSSRRASGPATAAKPMRRREN